MNDVATDVRDSTKLVSNISDVQSPHRTLLRRPPLADTVLIAKQFDLLWPVANKAINAVVAAPPLRSFLRVQAEAAS